jgi:hypothetical protein
MNREIAENIFNIQCLIIIISFLLSLRWIFFRHEQGYMKFFIFYTSVALIVMIPYFLLVNAIIKGFGFAIQLNNISLVFGFSFLSLFMINFNRDKKIKRLMNFIFSVIISFLVLSLVKGSITPINFLAFVINHGGLTLFSLVTLFSFYNSDEKINLTHEPYFWIVVGVLFCSTICFSVYLFCLLFFSQFKLGEFYSFIIDSLPSMGYIIMHLFFIKAFLCKLYHHKAY